MKKIYFKTCVFLTLCALTAGCAGVKPAASLQEFTPHTFPAGQYSQKVDNFLIILDTSSSMGKDAEQNIRTGKNLIGAINQSLPTDLNFNAGLRTFGHRDRLWNKPTTLAYGMTQYT